MAIVVRKFAVGKDADLGPLNRFLTENGIKQANVLHVEVVQLGRDRAEYVLTYQDVTAPFLVMTIPADGDSQIGEGTTIVATFSEPLTLVTVDDIEITNVTDGTTVSTSDYTIDNTDVAAQRGTIRIIDSGSYITAGKAYRITFKTSITDLAGNPLSTTEDVLLGAATTFTDLTVDGGKVLAAGFANPSLNRWTATVTPTRLTFSDSTLLELAFRGGTDEEFDGFNVHAEQTGASFVVVIEHGNRLITPEPTGVLPTGARVDWTALNGLL
jgi:hypothetical protein